MKATRRGTFLDSTHQSFAHWSDDAETMKDESAEKAASQTHRWCCRSGGRAAFHDDGSHNFIEESDEVVATVLMSGDTIHFNRYSL
jgi:hypothetical protein